MRTSGRVHRGWTTSMIVGAAGVLLSVASNHVRAQGESAQPSATVASETTQTPEFVVSGFEAVYDRPGPGLPSVEELMTLARVRLERQSSGFISTESGGTSYSITELNDLVKGGVSFSRQALEVVNRSLVRAMNELGLLGVLVATDPEDVSIEAAPGTEASPAAALWRDTREPGRTSLRLRLYTARVVQVRTVASGDRVPKDAGVDHPTHARIRDGSPVRPADAESGADLLRKDLIDDYTFRLNRHPGRRVDVAVSLADQPGDVVLDYLVRENKPWFVFGQIANNGTQQTEEIRERVGIVHNQLTGNDDQLIIDFVTGGFAGTYGVSGSYEFPIADRIRFRPFANYTRYDASQVGFADESFRGESWGVSGDLSWNFFQKRDLFIDLVGGLRWHHERVNNQVVDTVAEDDFFLPSIGLRLERYTDEASTSAYLRTEWNLDEIAGTGDPSLESLGRTDADESFEVLQWGLEQSVYLEPVFDSKRFKAGQSTLANELAVSVRAQHSLGARLPPTFQDVAGGVYSVRGYPESVSAGDDVYVGTAEYRLHIPRLYRPYDEIGGTPPTFFGEPFRLRPQTRYARPDWDLVLKAFVDVGRTENEDRLPFEQDETLIGSGVGIELLVGRNFNLRVDWGVALREVDQGTRVTEGSNRVHFVVTLLF